MSKSLNLQINSAKKCFAKTEKKCKKTCRQWWRWRHEPLPLPGARQVWWAVFGWFRPRARNLKSDLFYKKKMQIIFVFLSFLLISSKQLSYLFVISFAVVPSRLFEATVWAGRVSLPSCRENFHSDHFFIFWWRPFFYFLVETFFWFFGRDFF